MGMGYTQCVCCCYYFTNFYHIICSYVVPIYLHNVYICIFKCVRVCVSVCVCDITCVHVCIHMLVMCTFIYLFIFWRMVPCWWRPALVTCTCFACEGVESGGNVVWSVSVHRE